MGSSKRRSKSQGRCPKVRQKNYHFLSIFNHLFSKVPKKAHRNDRFFDKNTEITITVNEFDEVKTADEDIVYEHKTEKSIINTHYHERLRIHIMDDEYIYGKNDIFSVIIMLKFLLSNDEFRLMLKEFEYEFEKLDSILLTRHAIIHQDRFNFKFITC